MRIAHVGVELVPTENGAFVGGLVKNVATVARAQKDRGDDIELVTTDVHGRFRDGQEAVHGRIRRVETAGAYGSFLFASTFMARAARTLRRAHRADPFDLVHVHSAYGVFASLGRLLGGVSAPKVFSLYSPNFRTIPGHDCNGSSRLGGEALTRIALRGYDAVVVPSANLRGRLLSMGVPAAAVSQVSPILDPSFLGPMPTRDEARRRLGLPTDHPLVLFVGNYSPWKGVEVLLRAMADLRRGGADARLLTAWGEPYAWSGNRRDAVLGLMNELALGPVVEQAGIVPDIRQLLRAADVLVSPFLCTCKVLDHPLSILEAMACDTPVIGTTVGGVPELLGEGRGVAVPPGRSDLLSAAIRRLLDDPDGSAAMGRTAGRWARERGGAGPVLEGFDALYAHLCSTDRTPSPRPAPSPN